MVTTIAELYRVARDALSMEDDPRSAGMMARNLLCKVTGKTNEQIMAHRDMPVDKETCNQMEKLVKRVVAGEPLAYVLGEWDFYGMTLQVNNQVLIPRDDTCAVTELAIHQALFLSEAPRIMDLCTGSGCIGLAIASKVKDAKVTLADLSKDALKVAKKNVAAHRLGSRVSCVSVNALEDPAPFLGKFDMIVSNPPYITKREMWDLPDSVKRYEPRMALYGGEDGLDFYHAIADKFRAALKPGGYLCFEFGMGQGDDVCRILEENGYTVLERKNDFNDRERAVLARYDREED